MEKHTILICKLANTPGYVVPGSLPLRCAWCGQRVWVSPASMILLHDNPNTDLVCIACVTDKIELLPEHFEPLTPAQLEEIEEAARRKEV